MSGTRAETKVGTILDGRYRLDEVIGTGSMGTVYRATQLTVNRPVAVKVLNTSVQHHPKLQQRFEVEARAVGALNHPNVLTLYDFAYSMDKDLLYMVVEFIEGDTLSELIRREISPRLSIHIAYQIANALAHAHDAGVAHRDLKPGNVMLANERRGERVKVLDFGLARVRDDASAKRVTAAGDVQGAPGYMSPEQCIGDLETGPPADIYALGCIMFEMFDGVLPFNYDAPGKLMQAHIHEQPPTVQNRAVGQDVREMVEQMLSKAPEQRPTADKVMETLQPYIDVDVSMETLLRSEQIQATTLAEATSSPSVDRKRPKLSEITAAAPTNVEQPVAAKNPLIVVAVVLVVLNLITVAYFTLS